MSIWTNRHQTPKILLSELPLQEFNPIQERYNERDAIIYALGVGVGQAPEDPFELGFVYEKELNILPTFNATLASPTAWLQDLKHSIDLTQLVALSHRLNVFNQLPSAGSVTSYVRVTHVYDRGIGKGAVIHWERTLVLNESGQIISRLHARALARGNGGFGGEPSPKRNDEFVPDRPSDYSVEWQTTKAQSLLYRQSGDLNPLHVDPEIASDAGFARPILHGLCTLGIVAFNLMKIARYSDTSQIRKISTRYAGIVYPGEKLLIEFWQEKEQWHFQCKACERNSIVLDGGTATLAGSYSSF